MYVWLFLHQTLYIYYNWLYALAAASAVVVVVVVYKLFLY